MNLNEATKLLNDNGYIIYKNRLSLNEGLFDNITKIAKLITGWKKEAAKAKEEGDTETLNRISKDSEDLKSEIEDKKLLNDRVSPKVKKIVFAALLALMSMGAISNAHAAANSGVPGSSDFKQTEITSGGNGDGSFNALDRIANGDVSKNQIVQSNDEHKVTYEANNIGKFKTGSLGHGMLNSFVVSVDEDGDGHTDSQIRVSYEINGQTAEVTNISVDGHTYDNFKQMSSDLSDNRDLVKAIKTGIKMEFMQYHRQFSWLDKGAVLH